MNQRSSANGMPQGAPPQGFPPYTPPAQGVPPQGAPPYGMPYGAPPQGVPYPQPQQPPHPAVSAITQLRTPRKDIYARLGNAIRTLAFMVAAVLAAAALLQLIFVGITHLLGTAPKDRAPLPAEAVNETSYFTNASEGALSLDEWELDRGLLSFYGSTGVQPYVYLVSQDDTESSERMRQLARDLYDELFTDQGHFLFVMGLGADGIYRFSYFAGTDAARVMDPQVISILVDSAGENLSTPNVDAGHALSDAFRTTGETIMEKDDTVQNAVIVLVVIGVATGVYFLIRRARKRRDDQAQEQRMKAAFLAMPLETFQEEHVEELAEQYQKTKNASS